MGTAVHLRSIRTSYNIAFGRRRPSTASISGVILLREVSDLSVSCQPPLSESMNILMVKYEVLLGHVGGVTSLHLITNSKRLLSQTCEAAYIQEASLYGQIYEVQISRLRYFNGVERRRVVMAGGKKALIPSE